MTLEAKKIKREKPLYHLVQENAIPLPGEGDSTHNCHIQKIVMNINNKLESIGINKTIASDGFIREKKRGRY